MEIIDKQIDDLNFKKKIIEELYKTPKKNTKYAQFHDLSHILNPEYRLEKCIPTWTENMTNKVLECIKVKEIFDGDFIFLGSPDINKQYQGFAIVVPENISPMRFYSTSDYRSLPYCSEKIKEFILKNNIKYSVMIAQMLVLSLKFKDSVLDYLVGREKLLPLIENYKTLNIWE